METRLTANLHNFIRCLVSAVANATLYSLEHQQVIRLADTALHELLVCLHEHEELPLLVVDGRLVCCSAPLEGSFYFARLVQLMNAHRIGHVTFVRGIAIDELLQLIGALVTAAAGETRIQATPHVRLGQVEVQLNTGGTEEGQEQLQHRIPELADIPGEELALFMEMYDGVKKHRKLSISGISEIVAGFVASFHQVAGPMLALAPLRLLDEYTFTHSTTVCILNLAQAMSLGIEGQLLHEIGIAAMLHDVGKLYLPAEIITKEGKLTDDEWLLIREHPLKGAQYLLDTPGVPRLAVVTAFEHHMKYNQTGYPQVPAGWVQSLSGYMTTISDVFDALRTRRSYRGALEFERVVAIMGEMSGTDLHPFLADNFIKLLTALHEQEQGDQHLQLSPATNP